jgi:hypothetical protein
MAAVNISNGELAGLAPSVRKQIDNKNYIDFQDPSHAQWTQQYMPDLYEEEVEIYGDRTLSGFLSMAGAEIPLQSDQVIWQEQNRLHIAYNKCTFTPASASTVSAAGIELVVEDDKGEVVTNGHAIRKNSLLVIIDEATGTEAKAIVVKETGTADEANKIKVVNYKGTQFPSAMFGAAGSKPDLKIFVFGSEFDKGTDGMKGSVEPTLTTYNNSPIIMKDHYGINGSDTAQIGWVEVATEEGQSGYTWYLKAKSETMLRWKDYLEMAMVESEKSTNPQMAGSAGSIFDKSGAGTEGFFAAIEDRGNITTDGISGIEDFDEILKVLDTQGAIQENMLYLNRTQNLAFDDMLGSVNAHYGGGSSYGVFSNSESMALNLGFNGFRRGGYDFYKTDWKYLNDPQARGLSLSTANNAKGSNINGVLIPAGLTSVYDKSLGKNIKRPFLHIRYRSSDVDDRRNKSWVTGSVGARTSSEDRMDIHMLTERMLCVQAANNFVLFKNVA